MTVPRPALAGPPHLHQLATCKCAWVTAKGPDREDFAAIEASRNYGVSDIGTGEQFAYARVVTDGVTYAWLCDVFVATEARGQGIGKTLAAGLVADLEPLELKRILLSTGGCTPSTASPS